MSLNVYKKMSDEENKICDDCNNKGKLILSPACADSDVGYGICCEKYICEKNCDWNCSLCFTNVTINNINYVCFLEYVFLKHYKYHLEKHIKILKNIFPIKNKNIQTIFINLLDFKPNIRVDTKTTYYIPENCLGNKPIETTICNKCREKHFPNSKTNPPCLWWGISSKEWLRRDY
jgi:hypothetical protein